MSPTSWPADPTFVAEEPADRVSERVSSGYGRLRPLQPVRHSHLAKQDDRRGQMRLGQLPPVGPLAQAAQTEVALSRQGAHPQLLGQVECESVSGGRAIDVEGLLMRGDLGEEPEDIRLVSPLMLGSGDLEGAACVLQSLFGTPQQQ